MSSEGSGKSAHYEDFPESPLLVNNAISSKVSCACTYVVGTNNSFEYPQHMVKLMDKKTITISS